MVNIYVISLRKLTQSKKGRVGNEKGNKKMDCLLVDTDNAIICSDSGVRSRARYRRGCAGNCADTGSGAKYRKKCR